MLSFPAKHRVALVSGGCGFRVTGLGFRVLMVFGVGVHILEIGGSNFCWLRFGCEAEILRV